MSDSVAESKSGNTLVNGKTILGKYSKSPNNGDQNVNIESILFINTNNHYINFSTDFIDFSDFIGYNILKFFQAIFVPLHNKAVCASLLSGSCNKYFQIIGLNLSGY